MSREKQIEIKVFTYEQERLNYFTDLMNKANNKFNRLFKKYKDSPYLSEEFQRLSDAGHEAEFCKDVVKMLEKGYRKQSEGEWIRKLRYSRNYDDFFSYTCSECNTHRDAPTNYCPNCGAKMKGGAE